MTKYFAIALCLSILTTSTLALSQVPAPATNSTSTTATTQSSSSKEGALSTGAIAGIVVGSIIAQTLIVIGLNYGCKYCLTAQAVMQKQILALEPVPPSSIQQAQ